MKRLTTFVVLVILKFFCSQLCLAQNIEEPKAIKEDVKPLREEQTVVAGLREPIKGRTFYVRQTVGDDSNDGLSSAKAWRHISKLSTAMQAGDIAYIGPGVYRDQIVVKNSGTSEKWLTFIADSTGQHTGDPPGVVMITGADQIDESIFKPHSSPGVFTITAPKPVAGVVEMEGKQYRYARARDTKEHLIDKLSELEVVAKLPSSYYWDQKQRVLYIHTRDNKPPTEHEIEVILRGNGIVMHGKNYVKVVGFTFRHMGDAGVSFYTGSKGGIAINNICYGARQGIRVYNASDILVYGNIFFRNDNSGVYFAKQSLNGYAINNIAYENIKGVRWSSASGNGLSLGNIVFENYEAGISIEDVNYVILRNNKAVGNKKAQLMATRSQYDSEGNCFENSESDQLIALLLHTYRYKTLVEYQKSMHLDLNSTEGICGPLPEKINVRNLHEETMAYAERARKILGETQAGKSQKQ